MFVILLSISLTIYPLFSFSVYASIIALIVSIPLVYYKMIKPNFYIHNLTELLIYPGIAVVFVYLIFVSKPTTLNLFLFTLDINKYFSIFFMIFLLVLISIYDIWAVWKSGFMQKMAKYQMEELNIFGGFLVPTFRKKDKDKIKKLREIYRKNKNIDPKDIKKVRFNVALLGGGDVIFPLITMGIFMWVYPQYSLFGIKGLIPAIFVLIGAVLGLAYLFIYGEKDKAYPAMPYISTGIFVGIIFWYLFLYLS